MMRLVKILRNLFAVLPAVLVIGCAAQPDKPELPFWPKPPDPTRYVYEGVIRNPESIKVRTKADVMLKGGGSRYSEGYFGKPMDVASRDGKLVVSDTAARIVHLFDLRTRETYQMGARGEGKLTKPSGVGIDGVGNIYVADVTAQRVAVYDGTGHFKRLIGSKQELVRPTDVCVNADGSRVYVVDLGGVESDQHRVVVYDAEGGLVKTIGQRGGADGEFNLPSQCDVSLKDGRLYVLDAGNFRVQVFEPDGTFVRRWGKVGNELGNLARPRGLAVDDDDHVYVVDAAFANFQVFDSDGQLLMPVAGPSGIDVPGGFALPAGIAVDNKNFVYIVDQKFNKVEVLRKLTQQELEWKGDKK